MVPVNTPQLTFSCSIDEFRFLGPSVCLYFKLVQYMLLFMCIPLVASLICLMINFFSDKSNIYAIPNGLSDDEIFAQQWMHFLAWVIAAVVYPISAYKFLTTSIDLLTQKRTAADFAVKVSGIERLENPQELGGFLANKLQTEVRGERPIVDCVLPAYDLKDFDTVQKKMKRWQMEQARVDQQAFNPSGCCRREVRVTPQFCNAKIEQYQNRMQKILTTVDESNAPVAFLMFSREVDAKVFVSKFQASFVKQLCKLLKRKVCKRGQNEGPSQFDRMLLTFKRPSHPEDICFGNLAVTFVQRLKAQAITTAVSLGILLIGGGILYFVREYQKDELADRGDFYEFVLSLTASLLILFINLALEFTLAWITNFERHPSYTSYRTSVARKLIVLMFLNTAIVPTVVNAYVVGDDNVDAWFEDGGLCTDVYVIVFVNAFFPPLFYFYFFNFLWWANRFAKFRVDQGLAAGTLSILQCDANQAYTPLPIDLSERYAQVIKTLYVGMFFAPIVPLSVPISMLGILLDFIVTKYMLLYKHPKPSYHHEKLGLEMKEWMRFSIAIYAAGVAFFYFEIDGNVLTEGSYEWDRVVWFSFWIGLFGLLYFFFPLNYYIRKKVNEFWFGDISTTPAVTEQYRFKRLEFNTDFERANPILKQQGEFIFNQDRQFVEAWKSESDRPLSLFRFESRDAIVQRFNNLSRRA